MKLSAALRQNAGKSSPNNSGRWLPFWVHAQDTAGIMEHLAREWVPPSVANIICSYGSADGLIQLCKFTALVHDIGKLTCLFQYKISKSISGQLTYMEHYGLLQENIRFLYAAATPHARAGNAILQKYGCPMTLAAVVGSHHGKPQDQKFCADNDIELHPQNYYGVDPQEQQRWRSLWKEWIEASLNMAGFSSVDELPELTLEGQMLLSGLLVMADWIASNQTYFPLIDLDEALSEWDCEQRTEQAWNRLKLPGFWNAPSYYFDAGVFEQRFGFQPNDVQQAVLDALEGSEHPGLLILEAQMGVGKTEAALSAAEFLNLQREYDGIFFGLPTQATANGIFARLVQWGAQQSEETAHAIRLAHGAAELNEEYQSLFEGNAHLSEDEEESGLLVHSWFQGRKQALLANFVVGTVDQLLMAALKQKHIMLRHLGLAEKVVIIDECHAYDAYMNCYLDRVLSWLGAYHTPVILLSATLPVRRRAELVNAYLNAPRSKPAPWCENAAYPLLTWTDGAEVCQRSIPRQGSSLSVRMVSLLEEELPAMLSDRLSQGGCAGIIVNTVYRAQQLAQQLGELLPDFEVELFHSQFLMPDRAKKEAALLARVGKRSTPQTRDRLIVVGTQVLEQSLDLDFDLLVTDLCPMDLLLQRMGRLHRHQRLRPAPLEQAQCIVLQSEDGELEPGSRAIYGEWLLKRTQVLLPERILLPDDISPLVQAAYAEPEEALPAEWQTSKEAYEKRIKDQQARAKAYCLKKPSASRKTTRRVKTLVGLLDNDAGSDPKAEAAVRDGDPSIDVLVVRRRADGQICFLPWQNGGRSIPLDEVPEETLARQLARQKLRLPHRFCTPWQIDQTISELEQQSAFSGEWQKSSWLKGELFLVLDDELRGVLCGCDLQYQQNTGLLVMKQEEKDEI